MLSAKDRRGVPQAQTQDSLHLAKGAARFPWEVLELIFSLAPDPATLASLCLVSFTALEVADPLLYKHVTIRRIRDLVTMLFKPTTYAGRNAHRKIGTLTIRLDITDHPSTGPTLLLLKGLGYPVAGLSPARVNEKIDRAVRRDTPRPVSHLVIAVPKTSNFFRATQFAIRTIPRRVLPERVTWIDEASSAPTTTIRYLAPTELIDSRSGSIRLVGGLWKGVREINVIGPTPLSYGYLSDNSRRRYLPAPSYDPPLTEWCLFKELLSLCRRPIYNLPGPDSPSEIVVVIDLAPTGYRPNPAFSSFKDPKTGAPVPISNNDRLWRWRMAQSPMFTSPAPIHARELIRNFEHFRSKLNVALAEGKLTIQVSSAAQRDLVWSDILAVMSPSVMTWVEVKVKA